MANAYQLIINAHDRTQKAFKSVQSSMTKASRGARALTNAVGGVHGRVLALVGVGGMGALIAKSLQTTDVLAKTSDRLGIATEKLAGLQHAAAQTGASTESLNMGLQRMTRRIGQVASTGKGEAAVALDKLGISIDDIKNKSPDEQFALIAEKMKDVASQGEKVFLTQKLFDSEGVKLLNTLNLGSDGLGRMMNEAEELGIAITRVDAAKIEAANDAFDRVQKVIGAVGQKLAVHLAPLIEAISDKFVSASTKGGAMGRIVESAFKGMAKAAAFLSDAFRGIQLIIKMVEIAFRGLQTAFLNVADFIINKVLIPLDNMIRNALIDPLKSVIGLAANFSDAAADLLVKLDQMGEKKPFEALTMSAYHATQGLKQAQSEFYDLLSQELPSAVVERNVNEILQVAEEKAQVIADTAKKSAEIKTPITDIKSENKEEVKAEKDKLAQFANLKIGSSKKVAAVQKAITLKTAIIDGFAALQKAWASAPFPANIPAVALTTATTAANIAGIRGMAHDGIDNIPREGTWLLDKGERVVDQRTNADLKGFLSNNQTSDQPINITLTIPDTGNYNATNQWYEDNRDLIANDMRQAMQGV